MRAKMMAPTTPGGGGPPPMLRGGGPPPMPRGRAYKYEKKSYLVICKFCILSPL